MSTLEISQLLGNYGEFVGAIAIVVTLIYLTVQIKQNANLAKAQLNTNGFDAFSRYRQMSNENAEVVVKMQKGEHLSDADDVIAQNIISEALFAAAGGYENSKITDPSRCSQFVAVGASILKRHNWPWDANRAILETAGYADFTKHVTSNLQAE